jgi:hypothetical protein
MIVAVMIAILGLVVGSPASNVNAKKHTKCFLDGQVGGKGLKHLTQIDSHIVEKTIKMDFLWGCKSKGNDA